MMLAFIAGPTMQIGHQVAYLYLFIMSCLLQYLFRAAYLTDPMPQKMTYHIFIRESLCRKPPRYVPYKGTYVLYDGIYGASDQGQMLDV